MSEWICCIRFCLLFTIPPYHYAHIWEGITSLLNLEWKLYGLLCMAAGVGPPTGISSMIRCWGGCLNGCRYTNRHLSASMAARVQWFHEIHWNTDPLRFAKERNWRDWLLHWLLDSEKTGTTECWICWSGICTEMDWVTVSRRAWLETELTYQVMDLLQQMSMHKDG